MNIFYGVIILNLEELDEQEGEEGVKDQKDNLEMQLRTELKSIRRDFERSRITKKQSKDRTAVEIEEMSIENMMAGEQADGPTEQQQPPSAKVKNIINICLTLLITINLALEFEGQSSDFAFFTDTVDIGLFLCCFCVIIFTVVVEIKADKKLSLPTTIDIVLFIIYGSSMVYEAATA